MQAGRQTLGQQFILYNGPLFIGSILNWGLLGILVLQVYIYSRAGYRDNKWIRALVGTIFVLDILQTIFATHCVWNILILGWGDPTVFAHPPWTSATFPIMSGLIGSLVQTFFAWRIWVLQKTRLAMCTAILIVLIALMQCISGIVFSIRTLFIDILNINSLRSGVIVWLVGALACDVIIVVAMLIILYDARRPPIFERTLDLIDKLTIRTVHSGAVTAVAATVELVLFLVAPENFMHDTPVLFLGKLYSNILMANLNGRLKNDSTYASSAGLNTFMNGPGSIITHDIRDVPFDCHDEPSPSGSSGVVNLFKP